MASEMSTRVSNRSTSSKHVRSSIKVHGPKLVKILSQTGTKPLSEQEAERLLEWLDQTLADATTKLVNMESAYVAEQADDQPKRTRRDEQESLSADALSNVSLRLRSVTNGKALLQQYGIPSAAPRGPKSLHTVISNASTLLLAKEVKYTDAFGGEISTKELGTYLQKHADALGAALDDVQKEERELQEALIERDEALLDWGSKYRGVATTLEGIYRLAGLDELADRIRPTNRRRRGEEVPSQPVDDVTLSTPEPPVS